MTMLPSLRSILALLASSTISAAALAANNVVSGSAQIVGDNIQHQNGKFYDQVLLTGQSAVLQADGSKVLRCSLLDVNGDIMQCEFSGPGRFTIALDPATFLPSGPAQKYHQPSVSYVTGKPTITIEGNTADTYVTIFTVGKATAVNQALFPQNQSYDGVADVQLLQISGSAIGSILTGNARFSGASGMTGIFAPNTNVKYRAILHDIEASGGATPVLQFGSGSTFSQDTGSILLAGGDLSQANNVAIDITAGSGSTLASIVTVANIRSDGSTVQRATIASTVTWISGGSGTLLVDGTAVFDPATGGSSGTFSATFSELLASSNSPFKFTGDVAVKWTFSGGNNGTWNVETTTTTQGLTIKSTLSGTYTYSLSNGGRSFAFTLNYDQISASTGIGPALAFPINATSNPALPKSITMTANSTGASSGTYHYTLTMSNGQTTSFSGNYSATSPLGLPTS